MWAAILAADEHGYLCDATEIVGKAKAAVRPAPPPEWKTRLNRTATGYALRRTESASWSPGAELIYIVDISRTRVNATLTITVARREIRKSDGAWNTPKPYQLNQERLARVPVAEDRELLAMLLGAGAHDNFGYYYEGYERGAHTFSLPPVIAESALPRIVRSGRCFLPCGPNEASGPALQWDTGEPWRFLIEVKGSAAAGWILQGAFRRGEDRLPLDRVLAETTSGFLITRDRVARLAVEPGFAWIADFRNNQSFTVPERDRDEFLSTVLNTAAVPELDVPDEWKYEEIAVQPQAALHISQPGYSSKKNVMLAELSFDYAGHQLKEGASQRGIYHEPSRRFIRRDAAAEQQSRERLNELGLKYSTNDEGWLIPVNHTPRVVRTLVEDGWKVFADGKAFRRPDQFSASVASGVDWFDLEGQVRFGETTAQLPRLLAALSRGEKMIKLDDGTFGLLPEEWLRRLGPAAALGEADGDRIRFRASQAGVLDALLATAPAVNCDEAFRRVRQELERFQTIVPALQPAGFAGVLREYQREGLAWMHFLRQFSFGGCLADDMGVGKTAQVLALLETRRELRAKGEVDAPSLAVVPKSLVFNWKQEVDRFTPGIRVLDYTGIGRKREDLFRYDLILTTYGTLRRDVVHFRDRVFDYVILDEAQAVKNARTESAKAVRLLRGNHRLALSGTPVENHLGELWSLLDFLNPGMLGSMGAFESMSGAMRNAGTDTLRLLAPALRPFLLRRTKEQVARELPAKIEQTIYCEMEPEQKSLYESLRDHYRDSLLRRIQVDGIAKSKIQVLEALLRLRQAACHPGLVDRKLATDTSAKLDVLLEQLRDVLEEGHKALVFSQFTALLAIVRKKLDADGVKYEYLDGKTRDRQQRVERFQNDAACGLFLISLKAGGVGLNLTAADYVFILDPWWNPAVEAQAVDRTHRIGQIRQVFAYRLITRGTVEEKVLQLQQTKRGLADAIIGENNSLIRELRAEDIALLLS